MCRDIETCGLILGKLAKNVLTATVLMIPKQTGTSDTCSAEHEEDILEVAGNTNTIVMGWVSSSICNRLRCLRRSYRYIRTRTILYFSAASTYTLIAGMSVAK